ncbi:MAG: hypothetical protein CSA60_02680 [Neptuniibacter caesariensis]|uniref:DUF3530 domain-containing protein n=1 Tax=Neptuniibacter caesariensis TaxID=207954 RepID=A0A2G6JN68_NEPCE|nr:MAG: hypothetical protein CSA60_02680 [Neptuniibacter caesariensis]
MLSARFLPIITNMIIRILSCLLLLSAFSLPSAFAEDVAPGASAEDQATASAATASAPKPVPRTEPNIDTARINELVKIQDPTTEVLKLDTGKDGEQLIAFYRPEGSGIKQGGIILFPDTETHTDWPDTLHVLRTRLSDYGWYTLSIYLPTAERPAIPKRTLPVLAVIKPTGTKGTTPEQQPQDGATPPKTTEASQEDPQAPEAPATEDTQTQAAIDDSSAAATQPKEKYEAKVFRLVQTGLKYLQEKADVKRVIVLGVGSGATWAAKYVEQYQEQQDLRLVMIDARDPTTPDAPNLLQILPNLTVTVIDLHHSPQYSNLTQAAKDSPGQRLRLARHERMNNFHQSRLPPQKGNWKNSSSRLAKYTRGLINTYIIKAEQEQRNIQLKNDTQQQGENAPGIISERF